eukprot:gene31358-35810_t
MLVICLSVPLWASNQHAWTSAGALLLFYGLLTLVNAPFDWLSLGITRGLLRRGLERTGLWPAFYAVVDVLLSSLVIGALALAMVLAVQTFNDLAIFRAGADANILDVRELLAGIAQSPAEPEYFWVYALLLSTLLPSMINLMIGAASVLRGIPGLSGWLLAKMPDGRSVVSYDRAIVAAGLTAQIYFGIVIGLLLEAGIIYFILQLFLPTIGLDLLQVATELAEADFPARLIRAIPALAEMAARK